MKDKNSVVITGLLAVALVASWGYFYSAQKGSDAKLNALMAKMNAPAAGPGGKAPVDPYIAGAVKNTLRKHAVEMQKLWVAYLKNDPAKTEGFIEADWQIEPDGDVVDAGVIHSEFDDKALNEGVAKALKNIQYPPPPSGMRTYVSHKFNFKKDE